MRVIHLLCLSYLTVCIVVSAVTAQETEDIAVGRLKYVDSVSGDELQSVTSTAISGDGNFLYASAWRTKTISVFQRHSKSGRLEHRQSVVDDNDLNGATALRLSPDGRYALASAFRSQTAVLYTRDRMDGSLRKSDVAREGVNDVTGLTWAIDAAFSVDSKFVYVIDSKGPGAGAGDSGTVTVFSITDEGKLEFVEANNGKENCFGNARGIAMHPDGKTILVTCSGANTLVVLNRDKETGKTTIRQIVKDEDDGVHGLEGANGVAISPDGKFVYTASGRFRGDDSIGVFQFDDEGKLSVVQEIANGESGLEEFVGGNEIAVSPDGKNVYAVGTRNSSMACFERDNETGKLKAMKTIRRDDGAIEGAAGIGVTPDGNFVYIAAEENRTVSVFRRRVK